MMILWNSIATILMLSAAWLVVMNAVCVTKSLQNQKRGIDRHHSMVPIAAQIQLLVAALIPSSYPSWLLWTIALLDISLWTLAACLFTSLWKKISKR